MGIRFESPVLDKETKELYTKLYGRNGAQMIEVLQTAPPENAVISRFLTCLHQQLATKGDV